ncbi:MAG: hypothetical protein WAW00_00310 [Candidatus Moraniibacteriota bacterium]
MKQIRALRAFLPCVLVVADGVQDKGATRAWLAELNDPCVHLIEMMSGYTWSNALNRALHHISLMNAERVRAGTSPFEMMFNVSVEARFRKEHLEAMLAEFADEKVGVVGTSFRGVQEGNTISLGRSYRHPRNTGMIIRLSVFWHRMVRDFDAFCDDIGGMEDIDFVYRLKVFAGLETRMLDLGVDLIVGKHYNQSQKEARERDAMDKIFHRYRNWADELTASIVVAWKLMED